MDGSLNARRKANYRQQTAWPPGKRQPLTKAIAARIFDAISTSLDSLLGVLQQNPDFPPHAQIYSWRINTPWFAEGYRKARAEQGEFLAQHCLELARSTNPKNAHAIRVKFDIYKFFAAKFAPNIYGDKPAQQTTNVAIGFNVSTERLNEIRSKLDQTRIAFSTSNGKTISSSNDALKHNTTQNAGDDNSVSVDNNVSVPKRMITDSHVDD